MREGVREGVREEGTQTGCSCGGIHGDGAHTRSHVVCRMCVALPSLGVEGHESGVCIAVEVYSKVIRRWRWGGGGDEGEGEEQGEEGGTDLALSICLYSRLSQERRRR